MLSELRIENFALIESLRVELNPGLNVLTGETGAGKSIIIDAVEMLLGGRASSEYVRSGCDRAVVEAVFVISSNQRARALLRDWGVEEDDAVVLSREISSTGRSVARVAGRSATAGMLREIAGCLVDIHGQHEHQSLLRPETHIDVLDAFAGGTVAALKSKVAETYAEYQAVIREIRELGGGEKDRARRLDIVRFQVREIESVNPRPGEDATLADEATVLRNAQLLKNAARSAYSRLYEGRGQSAIDILGEAWSEVASAARVDPRLNQLAESISQVSEVVKDVARDIRIYAERVESNAARLGEVEARIDRIQQLKAKYGDTIDEILAYRDQCNAEIDRLENAAGLAERLGARRDEIEQSLGGICGHLSEERKSTAPRFEARMIEELDAMGVGRAAFSVELSTEEDAGGVPVDGRRLTVSARGVDRAEFLISPNPGEPPKPLARIASGGEMSRIMLALKSITADADQVPCVIFDEIDSGIGGETARAVASRLAGLGKTRQVLCVTHLAHIASRATSHFLIWKETDGARTITRVKSVSGSEREREIARMLGGSSEIALNHARELLEGD
ncbi:MAG: DNA repair protein RecN [Firmicutes bacterium]|nr:DNA repair protein RecN [Bacillota bacterium]